MLPRNMSIGRPPAKAKTLGIDCTPSWPAICGFSSMLILTSRTLPAFSLITFSMVGVRARQGPHQGSQKSTSTGATNEASMTSALKARSEDSLISAAGGAAGVGEDRLTFTGLLFSDGSPLVACRRELAPSAPELFVFVFF